jgi:hypothetical protein
LNILVQHPGRQFRAIEGRRTPFTTAYIDEFKDLINMSSYTDLITIVLKFHQGLNATMQDKIAESGTD